MNYFITGGAKNGKTSYAQKIALEMAGDGKRYFLATMIPVDEEDKERIRLHVADREGMGFETIECGRDISSCLHRYDKNATFLLDSITALFMNELFPQEKKYEMDRDAIKRCIGDIENFLGSVKNAVVVSDYIYSDANRYDEITETYRYGLACIDRKVAALSDVVVEMSGGQLIVHKGVESL